jgi:response regulator RpfG family c-di-GMP phosphodiesterase
VAFRIINNHDEVLDMECNAQIVRRKEGHPEFQLVIRDVTKRKRLQDKVIQSLRDVQNARSGTILGLAKLAEYRDTDTGEHLERMREFTRILAKEMANQPKYGNHITEKYIEDLYFSAPLHDIGKVGIPDHILLKKGRLTPEERKIMEKHTIFGGDVLKAVEARVGHQSFLRIGMQVAYCHHEKWDGTGYPNGLKGENIPLAARIVALADVYDAMTSKRVYKDADSHEDTRQTIIENRGRHFDPDVVDAFLLHEEDFKRILRLMHDDEETPLP